ncbi:MAG: UbiA family prenyltransferase [Pseudomonadota bacterium]
MPKKIIVVDLDGTLAKIDLLYESLVVLLTRKPWALLTLLLALFKGRAVFKRRLVERAQPDLDNLPLNQGLIEWLNARHREGAVLALYSASDERLLQRISVRVGLFERVRGSDGATNLKGLHKYEAIVADFGEQFTYVGDSRADLPIWQRCQSAVLVGDTARLKAQLSPETVVLAEFPQPRPGFTVWRRALRLHQWAKNALIFVPLLLLGEFDQAAPVKATLLGFLAFGLLASATYLINDLFDLSADRSHRSKQFRPLASGDLSLRSGLAAIPLLLLAAGLLITQLPLAFALVALIYTTLTLAYSIRLKREPILDVLILGSLFSLRLLAGMAVIAAAISPWLLTFSMFFFTSLATIKRFTECDAQLKVGKASVPGRGYRPADAGWLMAMGSASGFASVLVFFNYLVEVQSRMAQFERPEWLWSICLVLAYWLGRIWLLAARGEMQDDPIAFALRDRLSLLLGAWVALSVVVAVV